MTRNSTPGVTARGDAGFRPDIEGLRGIAVLLVVLYHAGVPGWPGGFVGVDAFFVLSGYLITGLLVRELERTGRIDFVEFYARRVRRLLPASALVLCATVGVAAVVLSPIEQSGVARTAVATAAYSSNLYFLVLKSDYFGASTESNPLVHTWSLSVEEQFYFVWPVLLLVVFRWARSRRSIGMALGGLVVVSLMASIVVTRYRQPWAFFGTPFRAWEFGLGGLASLIPATAVARWPRAHTVLGWTGLAAFLGAGMLLTKTVPFPGTAAVIPVLGTVALVATGAGPGVRTLLTNPVLTYVGRFSYGWYLWHWPVLVLASALFPNLALITRVLGMVLALAFAIATYYALENPVRFHPALRKRPRQTIVGAVGVTCLSVAIALGGRALAIRAKGVAGQREIAAAAEDRTPLWTSGCMAWFTHAIAHGCESGNRAGTTTVVLFGDSHAAHWFPGIERAANARGWRVVTFVKASCPAARVPVYNPELGRVEVECSAWRADAMRQIAAMHPALVVMANSSAYIAGTRPKDGYAQLSYAEWENGVQATAVTLDAEGVKTLLVRDVPSPRFNVPVCLSRALVQTGSTTGACAISISHGFDPAVRDAERQAIRGLRNVALLDLTDQFCTPTVCQSIRNGRIVYHDESHITASFATSLEPVLVRSIDAALATRVN